MLQTVLEQVATVIEDTTLDDRSITDRLYYDPRGESILNAAQDTSYFRRFAFGFPRQVVPFWSLDSPTAVPPYISAIIPMEVLYPCGTPDNLEYIAGMALDDATVLSHSVAINARDYFEANPVTDFQLMSARLTHDELVADETGLISSFTLTLRYAREL